jgi:hypothetical protein
MVNQSANKVRLKLIEKMFGNTAALPGMQIRQLPVFARFSGWSFDKALRQRKLSGI